MGHLDNRDALTQTPDPFNHPPFGLDIQCTGRLVEDQNVGLPIESSRDAQPLPLTAGQSDPTGPNHLVKTPRTGGDNVLELCNLDRHLQPRLVDKASVYSEGDVLPDRHVSQHHLLRHMGNRPHPSHPVHTDHRGPVEKNLSLAGLQEAHKHVKKGALALTGWPDDADPPTLDNREVDIGEHVT